MTRLGAVRPGPVARRAVLFVALAYLAVTFYLGSTAQVLVAQAFHAQDKLSHLAVFGGMQWSHLAAYEAWLPRVSFRRLRISAVLSASLVGGLLEAWQALLPHRSAELLDLLADVLGASLFALVYRRRLFSEADAP